jgi:imidazolonepropionase-like amidohydrolase
VTGPAAGGGRPDGTHDFTILTAARLIDGSGGAPLEDAAVLIEGDTIAAIGRRADVRAPDGVSATVHEFGDATILPGLVDGHTHLVGIGDGTRGDDVAVQGDDLLLIRAATNARAMLHSGVTTIRENGSMKGIAFSVREAIRRGIAEGPRMIVSGRA